MKLILFLFLSISLTTVAQVTSNETAVPETTEKTYRSTEVDIKPQVKDGNYTLSLFISENFKFPSGIKNKKVTIFSSFIIEPDGAMTTIKAFYVSVKDYIKTDVVLINTQSDKVAENDQIETMKAETVRVLKLFQKTWEPAIKEGKPVRCLYNYPINFNIE